MRLSRPRVTLLQLFSLLTLLGLVVIGLSLGELMSESVAVVAEARARDELTDVIRSRNPFWLDESPDAFRTVHVNSADDVARLQAQSVAAVADGKDWENKIGSIVAGLPTYQVKLWSPDARVIWTDRPADLGTTAPDDDDLTNAREGEVHAEFTTLN